MIVLCGFGGYGVRAAGSFPPAFVVSEVPVDGSGATGVAAREAARLQGTKLAFRRLLERLTNKADWQRLPMLDNQAVLDYVQDVEVTNERGSANRYLANYTFRFSPNGVRKLLRASNIAFSELASKPVILIPVLRQETGVKLFDDPNPWRAAWIANRGADGLVPYAVLQPDQADAAGFDPAGGRPDQIAALSARLNGGDVVIAQAMARGENGESVLDIMLTRYNADGTQDTVTTRASNAKADGVLFQTAVQGAVRELEEQWKKQITGGGGFAMAPGSPDQETVLKAVISIMGPADWVAVRDRLARSPLVRERTMELMTRSAVTIKLRLKGDASLSRVALAQQDLVLTPDAVSPGVATLRLRQPGETVGQSAFTPPPVTYPPTYPITYPSTPSVQPQ